MNALKKLGKGWKTEGENYRYDVSETVFLRAIKDKKGWVCVRFEVRQGEAGGTNGMFFPSLKQLVDHLAQED